MISTLATCITEPQLGRLYVENHTPENIQFSIPKVLIDTIGPDALILYHLAYGQYTTHITTSIETKEQQVMIGDTPLLLKVEVR